MNKNFILHFSLLMMLFLHLSCSEKKVELKNSSTSSGSPTEISPKMQEQSYYTCSMHPDIKEKKAGKCPICHMNLTKITLEDDHDHTQGSTESTETYYTCSMHPEIKEKKAGKCPICHMNLTKIVLESDEENAADANSSSSTMQHSSAADVVARVKLRKSQLQHFSPEYFPVTAMRMNKKVRLLGSVFQSEERESNIPARIGGRIEKVFVKSTGSFIRIGDPVIDLYSPRLITGGEEYILAKKSYLKNRSKEFKDLLLQSEERLKLWGIKKFQYESWYKLKKVPQNITIYSNATGIVRKRNVIVGKYFKEGQNFFELSDLSIVWVEMDVYEQDAALIHLGQKVEFEFTSLPGEMIKSEIDFISPVLNVSSRTLKVRTTVSNSTGKLKPGMVASATLNIEMEGTPLVIPRNAIIDTGKRKVVWVRVSNKKFQAKVIKTGYESEGYVEVTAGLKLNEAVVIEGNFLIDAQAQLFGGYENLN